MSDLDYQPTRFNVGQVFEVLAAHGRETEADYLKRYIDHLFFSLSFAAAREREAFEAGYEAGFQAGIFDVDVETAWKEYLAAKKEKT